LKIEEKIDWNQFEDRYVRLMTGIEKALVLTNWTSGVWFGKPGLNFDVIKEDGKDVANRQLTVTSNRLIRLLKPILMLAEHQNKNSIAVAILKTGEEQDTRYTVEEFPVEG